MDACPGCGFRYDSTDVAIVGTSIVEAATDFTALLLRSSGDVATRHEPSTWSPLEYACHLRDVLLVQRERALLARRRDRASVQAMGREERVAHDGYAHQSPPAVARQLLDAAQMFANVLARLDARDWDRTLVYDYDTPSERTLAWVAAHTLHEVRHHAVDVQRQLA